MNKCINLTLLVFSFSAISSATTIHVPDDQPTIQTGLNTANEGDTVLVAAGTYFENITWPIVNGIKLIGSGQDTCIIDGDLLGSVIRFQAGTIDTTTVLTGFTIQGGYVEHPMPSPFGGGISCENSSPSIMDTRIESNYADAGGGVYCSNSGIIFQRVTITDNTARFGAGLICFASALVLVETVVDSNHASEHGGGISAGNNSQLALTRVTICYNSAERGGSIYCNGAEFNCDSVTVRDNRADFGGGVYCSGGSFLNGMELAANIAEKGGGIYLHGSPSFDELTIHNNRATISGGGLYCWENSTPGFTDVTIRGNFAPTGGGVYCEQGSSLQFSEQNRNNLYFNCDAAGRGLGADIYSNNCNLMYVALDSFSVMTPTSYHASPVDSFTFDIWHAAGELLEGDAYVAVDGDDANPGTTPSSPFRTISHALSCVLPDNQIHLAPGVYSPSTNGEVFPIYWSDRISLAGSGVSETVLDAEQTGQLLVLHEISACHISNLTLTGGVAEQGGGIQCSNAVVSIVNCAITGNSAAGEWQSDGGGIYCEQSDITLENVIVNGNSSEGHGGGLYLYESSPLFSQSLITGNSAVDHGGGLYCAVSYPDLQQVTFSDNSASDGGGIYCIWESCPGLENCIMWGDQPQEISFYSMFGWNALTISCSNIEGGEESIETNGNGAVYWAEDNIDADPLFCDPDNGDYRLPLESPCRTDVCGFMGFTGETCEGEDVPNVGAAPRGCPDAVTLSQNYPNPFNPTTTIEFTLPYPQDIQLSVYNIMGQHIEVLARGCYSAGVHQVQFDGSKLTSGVYVCRLAVGEYVNTRKMLLIR